MCTSLRLRADDGSICVGRTMEFPDMLGAKLTVLPVGHEGVGSAPGGVGRRWISTHGVVGMDVMGDTGSLTDGMNTAGVYAGLLYMPGFCDYQDPDRADPADCLAPADLVAYVLGTAGTVAEAMDATGSAVVWSQSIEAIGGVAPLHLVLHDASGASAVVEWRNGQQEHTHNPIGVTTNSPYLDWHLDNLRARLPGLVPDNPIGPVISGHHLEPLGQGQGFSGLPGDSSGPSRFVRAAFYVANASPSADAVALEQSVLHIMNNFDIPDGIVRGFGVGGRPQCDTTTWTSIASLTERRYVVRTQGGPLPYVVDLGQTDFDSGVRQRDIPLDGFVPLEV